MKLYIYNHAGTCACVYNPESPLPNPHSQEMQKKNIFVYIYPRFENYSNFWLVKTPGIKNPYSRVLLVTDQMLL
jgi:hypothetical protein